MIETRNQAGLGLILAYLSYFRAFNSYWLIWGLLGQLGGFGGLLDPILKGIWAHSWSIKGGRKPILGLSRGSKADFLRGYEPILGLSRRSGPILSPEKGIWGSF